MLKGILIRHGKTYGNMLGRYIGSRTDEPLCREGIRLLREKKYPPAEYVYTSPMRRCLETAGEIYPGVPCGRNHLLAECDFGAFENKNYKELAGDARYQAWIDSGGTLPFPQGESQEAFRKRCEKGFEQCVEDAWAKGRRQTAMVVHGGTVMSILCRFAVPSGEYFKWQIKNGEYYELTLERGLWDKKRQIRSVERGQF